jgi:hypothetical protein
MRVHRGSHQFKIFADGIADIFGIDVLVSVSNEMVLRVGSRRASDPNRVSRLPPSARWPNCYLRSVSCWGGNQNKECEV